MSPLGTFATCRRTPTMSVDGGAGSTGRRNTGVKSLCWGFKLQGLTWPFVQLTSHFVQIGLRVHRQVGALRKVLSQQAIGVLVRPALPRALRIAKIYVGVRTESGSHVAPAPAFVRPARCVGARYRACASCSTITMLSSPFAFVSGRLGRLQPTSFFDTLAHDEFLHFPGGGHWKFVYKLDVARNLLMSDLPAAEVTDVILRHRLAFAQPDPGTQLFTVLLVGHTEDLYVLNFRMAKQEFFDLARIEVLTAADHHVLDPSDNVAVALYIQSCEVTRVHPARGVNHVSGLLLIAPIAEHDGVAAGAEFA